MISLKEARLILGEEYDTVDDKTIVELVQLMDAICRYVISEDDNGNIKD